MNNNNKVTNITYFFVIDYISIKRALLYFTIEKKLALILFRCFVQHCANSEIKQKHEITMVIEK